MSIDNSDLFHGGSSSSGGGGGRDSGFTSRSLESLKGVSLLVDGAHGAHLVLVDAHSAGLLSLREVSFMGFDGSIDGGLSLHEVKFLGVGASGDGLLSLQEVSFRSSPLLHGFSTVGVEGSDLTVEFAVLGYDTTPNSHHLSVNSGHVLLTESSFTFSEIDLMFESGFSLAEVSDLRCVRSQVLGVAEVPCVDLSGEQSHFVSVILFALLEVADSGGHLTRKSSFEGYLSLRSSNHGSLLSGNLRLGSS